jgi:hypothetical protein
MGNLFSNCKHKDFKVETVFGNCGCSESVCSCFASAEESDEMTKQIAIALRVELANIEHTMKQATIANIKKFGTMPQINVLDAGAQSPNLDPQVNTLSVSVKMNELVEPLEYPVGKAAAEKDMPFSISV